MEAGVVRAQAFGLIAIQAALVAGAGPARGMRRVAPSRAARSVRTVGLLTVAGATLLLLRAPGPHADWWPAPTALLLDLFALLVVTATGTGAALRLRTVGLASAAGLLTWWVAMLGLPAVRAIPQLAWIGVAVSVVGALVGASSGPLVAFREALASGAATCLLIFVAAVGTYAAAPTLVPDISGPFCCAGGLTAVDRAETNRIESTDPYIGEFLIGALSAGTLAAVMLGRTRRRVLAVTGAQPEPTG